LIDSLIFKNKSKLNYENKRLIIINKRRYASYPAVPEFMFVPMALKQFISDNNVVPLAEVDGLTVSLAAELAPEVRGS
jgi:hypothetical protein